MAKMYLEITIHAQVNIEVYAETLEGAMALAKDMKWYEVVDMDHEKVDGVMEVTGVFRPVELEKETEHG